MQPNSSSDSEQMLAELIREVPLQEPPGDLTGRVMARLAGRRRTVLDAIRDAVFQPRSISFRPVYAGLVVVLVVASFYLGASRPRPPVSEPGEAPAAGALAPDHLDSAAAAHAVGRALLQSGDRPGQALAYLRRASQLDPGNPEFAYWEGIGYWTNGDQELERRSYRRGLAADPDNIALLINLGHSYLSDRRYDEALGVYQSVLRLSPDEPAARYNSGLIYRALGQAAEEMAAWRAYLRSERSDAKAFRAVRRLNEYGDFSYRIYPIGSQRVIVAHRTLLDDSLPLRRRAEELAGIAALLARNETMVLEVVASVADDPEAARNRALAVRDMIELAGGAELRDRVRLSWFDRPEPILRGDGKAPAELSEGVLLFSFFPGNVNEEVSI